MKPRLLIATANEGKLREFRGLLSNTFECLTPHDPIFSAAPPEVIEDGTTYFENGLKKALAYARIFRVPTLSDDSGVEVDGLNGDPGVFSARYGGEALSWPDRWKFLLGNLAQLPPDRWTARFRCVLCYYDGVADPVFFSGRTEGRIVAAPTGKHGFGYDPIFFSSDLGKTFGEASDAEKHRVSHRARALTSFLDWWKKQS